MSALEIATAILGLLTLIRIADLFLTPEQQHRIESWCETAALRLSYARFPELFSRIAARRGTLLVISTGFILSTYPLWRAVVLPLIVLRTADDIFALFAVVVFSLIALKHSHEAGSHTVELLAHQPAAQGQYPVSLFLARFARSALFFVSAFAFHTCLNAIGLWATYKLFDLQSDVTRFAIAGAWPWLYQLLALSSGVAFSVAVWLIEASGAVTLTAARKLVWKVATFNKGPIAFVIAALTIVCATVDIYVRLSRTDASRPEAPSVNRPTSPKTGPASDTNGRRGL